MRSLIPAVSSLALSFAVPSCGVSAFCPASSTCMAPNIPAARRRGARGAFDESRRASALSAAASTPGEDGLSGDGLTAPNASSEPAQTRRDVLSVAGHLLGCLAAATVVSTYEDYDVTHLKPNRASLRQSDIVSPDGSKRGGSIIGSATRGMGWGRSDREPGPYQARYGEQTGREIPSYNEVMERHRAERVPRWIAADSSGGSALSEADVTQSVKGIYSALHALEDLKAMAQDYDWEGMDALILSPVLSTDLERATSDLRAARSYLTEDARRDVIGFDWGSCAWRHCGAAADAQEALAELRNSLGMFEPFECLFVVDIVERSLRDVLDVIPERLKPRGKEWLLRPYVKYESRADTEGTQAYEGTEIALDTDFLGALASLRNDLFSLQ